LSSVIVFYCGDLLCFAKTYWLEGSILKVLIVAPADSLHAVRWIERLEKNEIECILYDMTSKDRQQHLEITNIYRSETRGILPSICRILGKLGKLGSLFSSSLRIFIDYKSIKVVIKKHEPDLINIHWLYHHAAIAASFFGKIPKVTTPWGSDLLVPEYQSPGHSMDKIFHSFLVGRVVRSADASCCDAVHMKSALVDFGAKESSVELIYFGTNTRVFSPQIRSVLFRSKYGIQEDDCVVLSNRQLAAVYDIETLLRAVATIKDRSLNLKLVIVGGGPEEASLKSKVEELNIGELTIFTGRLNDEDFAVATASCDIYVSTSPTDGGIAASVAEAMSCEAPVIITNFGDNGYWLRNQSAGLLFESGDHFRLASQIRLLATNPEKRHEMGKIGRSIILSENDSELETKKIIELYRGVILAHKN
jgi:glycosyltransferase involved in cell wall biosynthesis